MADKITQTKSLKLETSFVDGDTRTITISNISANTIEATLVAELNEYIYDNNILIGDKTGAHFARIDKATKVTKRTTTLDLT